MPPDERRERMRRLRRVVAGQDVFDWASVILENLERVRARRPWFGRVA
jgi:trehalose-6-phosphate synthase